MDRTPTGSADISKSQNKACPQNNAVNAFRKEENVVAVVYPVTGYPQKEWDHRETPKRLISPEKNEEVLNNKRH